jgi:hypothetical protein
MTSPTTIQAANEAKNAHIHALAKAREDLAQARQRLRIAELDHQEAVALARRDGRSIGLTGREIQRAAGIQSSRFYQIPPASPEGQS